MSRFGPSGSPGVDALLQVAEQLRSEPEARSVLRFPEHVQTLQTFRRSLESEVRQSLKLVPRSERVRALEEELNQEFERFRGGGRRLDLFCSEGRPEDLEVGCQRVHAAVSRLATLAGELRSLESGWKEQHGEGLAGELRFLLASVAAGSLVPQAALPALQSCLEGCRALQAQVAVARPESDDVAAQLQRCEASLTAFVRTLDGIVVSLRAGRLWEVETALDDAVAGARELEATQRALTALLQPPVSCPACGLSQVPDRAVCRSCSARLPLAAPVALADQTVVEEGKPRFVAFAELDALLGQNPVPRQKCMSLVSSFAGRLAAGRAQMDADEKLDPGLRRAMLAAVDETAAMLARLGEDLKLGSAADLAERHTELLRCEQAMAEARELALLQSSPNS